MTVIEARVKRWGNSLGVIIPSETVFSRRIKENENVKIIILNDSKKALRETFRIARGKTNKT
ncbi:MAG: hypothetical protein WCK29_02180, partial [archaeon]